MQQNSWKDSLLYSYASRYSKAVTTTAAAAITTDTPWSLPSHGLDGRIPVPVFPRPTAASDPRLLRSSFTTTTNPLQNLLFQNFLFYFFLLPKISSINTKLNENVVRRTAGKFPLKEEEN